MAIALIQKAQSDTNAGSATLAYGSNVVIGNLLVVVLRIGASVVTYSLSDTRGNTYIPCTQQFIPTVGYVQLFYCFNISSGANTVSLNLNSASDTMRIAIFEYSGVGGLDIEANVATGTSTTSASASFTPTFDNSLVIAFSGSNNAITMTAGTSFTLEEAVPPTPPNHRLGVEDWIQTTKTASTGSITYSGSQQWQAGYAVFRPGFAFVQDGSCSPSGGPFPQTAPFPSPVKVGSLLIALVIWNPSTTVSLSDPNNGTWTPIGSPGVATGSLAGFFSQFFYIPSAVAGSTTVTGTGTAAFAEIYVAEYSYSGTLSIDGTPSNTMVTSVAGVSTSGTVVTTGASDLLFAASMVEDSTCNGAGTNFTARDGVNWNNLNGGLAGDWTTAPVGSRSAGFTQNGATDAVLMGIVAFMTGTSAPPFTGIPFFDLAPGSCISWRDN